MNDYKIGDCIQAILYNGEILEGFITDTNIHKGRKTYSLGSICRFVYGSQILGKFKPA